MDRNARTNKRALTCTHKQAGMRADHRPRSPGLATPCDGSEVGQEPTGLSSCAPGWRQDGGFLE